MSWSVSWKDWSAVFKVTVMIQNFLGWMFVSPVFSVPHRYFCNQSRLVDVLVTRPIADKAGIIQHTDNNWLAISRHSAGGILRCTACFNWPFLLGNSRREGVVLLIIEDKNSMPLFLQPVSVGFDWQCTVLWVDYKSIVCVCCSDCCLRFGIKDHYYYGIFYPLFSLFFSGGADMEFNKHYLPVDNIQYWPVASFIYVCSCFLGLSSLWCHCLQC